MSDRRGQGAWVNRCCVPFVACHLRRTLSESRPLLTLRFSVCCSTIKRVSSTSQRLPLCAAFFALHVPPAIPQKSGIRFRSFVLASISRSRTALFDPPNLASSCYRTCARCVGGRSCTDLLHDCFGIIFPTVPGICNPKWGAHRRQGPDIAIAADACQAQQRRRSAKSLRSSTLMPKAR